MPRKSTIRYYPSRKAYYTQINGCQNHLATGPDDYPEGPTYQAALKKFGELMGFKSADTAGSENTCRVVLETYLRWLEPRRKPATIRIRKDVYVPFCDVLGETKVGDLTQFKVYNWLDSMRQPHRHSNNGHMVKWRDASVRTALDALNAALNWAVKSGMIPKNPLRGMERPRPRSKGREAVLQHGDHEKIIETAYPMLADFCIVLEATGARPGEIAHATAADYDPKLEAFVFHGDPEDGEFSHKTACKGKTRIIYLHGEALEVVQSHKRQFPKGPLFGAVPKDQRGKARKVLRPWSAQDIVNLFLRLRRKAGLPKLTAYSYRHTFATRWILSGRSVDILAQILGNTPEVIRRHYAHLFGAHDSIREHIASYRREQANVVAGTETPEDCPYVAGLLAWL